MAPTIQDLRFIVFLLDSEYDEHDGMVFKKHDDAKDWIKRCIKNNYGSKFIVGTFTENGSPESYISMIETHGIKIKNKMPGGAEQLSLFS